ncbi:MAG: ComEC/Rec2 family competence protein, partial [Pseudomonadota bacterium]
MNSTAPRRPTTYRGRHFLWLPVCFGIGIGIYFSLRVEPLPWLVACLTVALVLGALLVRSRSTLYVAMVACATVAAGFSCATLRTYTVSAPVLAIDLRTATLSGFVSDVAVRSDGGPRIILDVTNIVGLPRNRHPARAAIRLMQPVTEGRAPPQIGAHVILRASLRPPPRPALPGGYDFARAHYYKRIGASGFTFDWPRAVPPPLGRDTPPALRFRARIDRLRQALGETIRQTIGGSQGAIAAALITGDRGAIPDETRQAYRDAGIAH